jgi:RNA polymerase sigma-70 factor (ECF subfamily)
VLSGVGLFEVASASQTFGGTRQFPRPFSRNLLQGEAIVTNEIESLVGRAGSLESAAAAARKTGDESAAEGFFREALGFALDAVHRAAEVSSQPERLEVLRLAVRLGLECGEAAEARRLMEEALTVDASVKFSDEWGQFYDTAAWPDTWLVAAVRRESPDVPALDVLADRYWKPLFGRCQLLTLNRERASDLAQQAWCRVLRARQRLRPGGNFPAYLMTIATNLWRDTQRGARRAGPLSEDRVASLDQALSVDDGDDAVLSDVLPDLNSLREEERVMLKLDIDQALKQLAPHLREVLIARFISGESCAEIGTRYERTEQTISGWVREAIRQMKLYFEQPGPRAVQAREP